jgi:sugar phosphate isomerase/epimerase
LPLPNIPGFPEGVPDDPAMRVDVMCESVRALAAYEPVGCVCATGPYGKYDEGDGREIVVRGLKRLARVAADSGMVLAIEPIHSSLAEFFSFVHGLPDAADLLADVGEDNVRILVDIWHLGDDPKLIDDVQQYASLIAGVHVNDRPAQPRSWCDRLLPGDGIADLPRILHALETVGYAGWYELEVISDDGRFGESLPDSLWKIEPAELLRRGRTQFMEAWAAGQGPPLAAGPAPR